MRVHHVGYAVKDIEKAIAAFEALGYNKTSDITDDVGRGVKIVFVRNEHEMVELIAPNAENSAVDSVLKKNGPFPYHICYEAEDLDESMKCLRECGFITIIPAQAAPALENRRVVFLLNKNVGIIELVEISQY